MSILSDMIKEEYERLIRTISSYEQVVSELPKGSITKKNIGGRQYSYLQWRKSDKVKSKYIKPEDLAEVSEQVLRRKQLRNEIKEMYRSKKEFERVLGREL